ncbi:acetyl-CoA carboxylase, carboxyltransferase subunit beta [Sphingomonas sp. LY54]|uniref:acetyl-CoA carboxylase, carboxyltransferase subunit beta n=1 Tax=Sphingomonadales TaxID=204457 RepID=UPI002ADEEE54|nr:MULTISPECIES: acetyl-CoA carboxylase, carboxyltransferase subunit beta [Sphingomonadales]MEA1013089.1 acetyl-CoA carboxylase, carboxyltransferase subunit beta [Sphingosinicella sp. LY1275]WRP28498.1 acetyl-CoA carboxylase, carboxyltransferase subunit beta [Sphingomonas sp. LY54]
MSWLNRVRQSIPFLPKRETPDNLWHKCRSCEAMIFTREWEENDFVCPRCDHHNRIGPKQRFERIFDPGFQLLAPPPVQEDPLKFRDSKRYADRIKAARQNTGEVDALVNARGTVEGQRAVIGVQDFAFMGGSMGMGVGAAFVAGARAAIADRCPYIIFTAAGGARMQEGILSLMQMPKTTVAIAELKEAGLPYIVVLTDPTTGGVTASYAMLGDVQISEPNALIGFAGQRVIESTIREKLPEGFQRAEYLLDHGMIDMVVHRKDLRQRLAQLIAYLTPQKAAA